MPTPFSGRSIRLARKYINLQTGEAYFFLILDINFHLETSYSQPTMVAVCSSALSHHFKLGYALFALLYTGFIYREKLPVIGQYRTISASPVVYTALLPRYSVPSESLLELAVQPRTFFVASSHALHDPVPSGRD